MLFSTPYSWLVPPPLFCYAKIVGGSVIFNDRRRLESTSSFLKWNFAGFCLYSTDANGNE
jgi:hypothetical protein